MIRIVPATAEMFRAIDGEPPARTTRAVAVLDGERVLGVAGLYPDAGRQVLFAGIAQSARAEIGRHKRAIVQCSRVVLGMALRRRLPVHSVADPAIEGSDRLLRHLGFSHLKDGVYEWPGSRSR